MRKQPAIDHSPSISMANSARTVTVLSISPDEADHLCLQSIIGHSKWNLFTATDLASAFSVLHGHEISVVVCERTLQTGTWIDVLENIKVLPNAPSLIVASRLADDRLWAEALNLGAWDVLAKPFDHIEVIRSVKSAWQRWHDQIHPRATAMAMWAAS